MTRDQLRTWSDNNIGKALGIAARGPEMAQVLALCAIAQAVLALTAPETDDEAAP